MKRVLVLGATAAMVAASVAADTRRRHRTPPPCPPRHDTALTATPPAPAGSTASYIVTTRASVEPAETVADAAPRADVAEVSGPAFTGAVADLSPRKPTASPRRPGWCPSKPSSCSPRRRTRRPVGCPPRRRHRGDWTAPTSVACPWTARTLPSAPDVGWTSTSSTAGYDTDNAEFAGRIGEGAFSNGTEHRGLLRSRHPCRRDHRVEPLRHGARGHVAPREGPRL